MKQFCYILYSLLLPSLLLAQTPSKLVPNDWPKEFEAIFAAPSQQVTLKLKGKGLSTLPPEFGQLQNLTKLDLSHNQIAELPACIYQLEKLEELYLSHNQLTHIGADIYQLKNLKILHIEGNPKLIHITNQIGALPHLEVLKIGMNPSSEQNLNPCLLNELPKSFQALQTLRHLVITGTHIKDVTFLSQMPNIKELHLKYNLIEDLKPICAVKQLKKLDISGNPISVIPSEIGQLKALEWFKFHGHPATSKKLVNLPESFAKLTQLKSFYLTGTSVQTLPNLGEIKQLLSLTLNNNALNKLPNSIVHLKHLQTLDLLENQLKTLPENIGQLQALKTLNIASNQLETLPSSIGQLSILRTLIANNNQLKTLPPSINQLQSLKELNVAQNNLTDLPIMNDMTALQVLEIGRNRFTTLPDSFCKAPNLLSLFAYNCHIQNIPSTIANLPQLHTIVLHGNPLQKFPTALANIPNLKVVEVSKQYFSGNKRQQLEELLKGVRVSFL